MYRLIAANATLAATRLTRRAALRQCTNVRNFQTGAVLSTATPTSVKWEAVPEVVQTGTILTYAKMNFFQVIVFPYTYTVMYYMDFLLNYLPWWQAIIVTTASARLLFFPLVVKQNAVGIRMNNISPETQKIHLQITESMQVGDVYKTSMLRLKLKMLFSENNVALKDRLIPVLIQAPMYASIFFLLRTMTNLQAEGLTTGGALWFTDLTQHDPYYILPLITSTSMFIMMEYGMEGSVNPSTMAPIGRYFMRSLPFIMFAFIQSFPAATLLFWSTSNIFTMGYAFLLKNSWVKKKLNLPVRIIHDPSTLPLSQMSLKSQFKDTIEKGKAKRNSMDVRRLDDIAFKKAGVGPLRKTYKEPPGSHE